jgi:hypothetical protein
MVERFPLYWPDGWDRTPRNYRVLSRFKTGFATSRDFLLAEIKRLGGRDTILSTNVRLRQDGLPYATDREPEDSGAAVYFTYKGQQMCFACDRYRTVKENLTAIGKTIEALRGMERWGASDMMERAFRGFAALGSGTPWREVFGAPAPTNRDEVYSRFKELAKKTHPDVGGSREDFDALIAARDEALAEFSS